MSVLRRSSFLAMGTRVDVIVPREGADLAERLVTGLFAEREAVLSRFRPESGLSRLNRSAGRPAPAGEVLLRAVEGALAAARATGGAFDPALGAQMAALGYDRSFEEVAPGRPDSGERPAPGGAWRRVVVDRAAGRVTLPPGARLDLGGIAKGMTVDDALALLRGEGLPCALVSAGGDLAVLGRPPGRRAWTVAVRTPAGPVRVALERGALATSGVERRAWRQGGRRRHHLVDPATGAPAAGGLWSATAVAGSCERAEAASTAAFVLGPGAGGRLLEELGMPGLLVAPSGATLPVGQWPRAQAA